MKETQFEFVLNKSIFSQFFKIQYMIFFVCNDKKSEQILKQNIKSLQQQRSGGASYERL